MKPKLKPPRSKRLKLKCVVPLSNFAYKFNLRRYIPLPAVGPGMTPQQAAAVAEAKQQAAAAEAALAKVHTASWQTVNGPGSIQAATGGGMSGGMYLTPAAAGQAAAAGIGLQPADREAAAAAAAFNAAAEAGSSAGPGYAPGGAPERGTLTAVKPSTSSSAGVTVPVVDRTGSHRQVALPGGGGGGGGGGRLGGGTTGLGGTTGDIYNSRGDALRVLGPLAALVQGGAGDNTSTDPRYGALAHVRQGGGDGGGALQHFPPLPTWAWAHVIGCLDAEELLTLGQCSKQLYQASRHQPLWRGLYLRTRVWRQPDWLWEKGQGLTLVHFSAQPTPCWSHLCLSACLIDWGEIMHPTYPTKCA